MDIDTLEVVARAEPDFQILAGDHAFITPTLLMGGAGAIAAAAHICTPTFVEMTPCTFRGSHSVQRTGSRAPSNCHHRLQ